jgi:hypothetical protein
MMMIDSMKLAFLALAFGTAGAGRAEAQTATPISAERAEARYQLVEVAGSKLPVVVEKEWRCQESVTRGTLTLESDSVWIFRSTLREECGSQARVETEIEHGRYTRDGTTLRFYDDDEDADDGKDWDLRVDLDLDDFESGSVAPDGALAVRLRDGETTLIFRR